MTVSDDTVDYSSIHSDILERFESNNAITITSTASYEHDTDNFSATDSGRSDFGEQVTEKHDFEGVLQIQPNAIILEPENHHRKHLSTDDIVLVERVISVSAGFRLLLGVLWRD